MAATNFTPISLYYTTTAAAAPSAGNLVNGELAINITDGKLYYKDNLGVVKVIAGAGGAGVAGGSNTQVQFNSSGNLAGSANMVFDGTTLTVNGLATTGTVTLGDASGDALTINSSAVSIPNGLNFDSNTFVIDATNNRVGVGTASPDSSLHINTGGNVSTGGITLRNSTNQQHFWYLSSNTTSTFEINSGSGAWTWANGGGERLRLTSTGTVLVGKASSSFSTAGVEIEAAGYLALTRSDRSLAVNRLSTDGALIELYRDSVSKATLGISSDALTFGTGATERMRITSAGNVGIGTSSPSYRLDIAGTNAAQNTVVIGPTSAASSYSGLLQFRDDTATRRWAFGILQSSGATALSFYDVVASAERMRLNSSGNLGLGVTPSAYQSGWTGIQILGTGANIKSNGSITIDVASNTTGDFKYATTSLASTYRQTLGQHQWFNAPSGTAGNAITFTQAMTLDASGNLLVGKTSTNGATVGVELLPSGLSTFTRSGGYPLYVRRNTNDGDLVVWINNAGSVVGAVTISGSTTTYNTSSDYRLKENIAPMTGALAKVAQLKPVTYSWKVDGSAGEGFIAHELQEIVPDCVTGEKDGIDEEGNPKYQGIDTSFLVATLTASIQELKAIVDAQAERIAVLESK
jgi:hypothetical protein